MADTKISAMPNANPLDGTELAPLVQGGVNVKATIEDINAVITNHGSFYSVLDQNYVANTANPVIVENTAFSQGISVVNNTDITIANPGTYNLQFSFQLTNSDSQIHTASFWIRLNGVDYPDSNTEIDVPSSHGGNSGKIVAAWNIMGVAVNPNDFVQIMWSANNSGVEISHIAPQINPTRPATPSAIITVQQVA
jgi:hypothetical protein